MLLPVRQLHRSDQLSLDTQICKCRKRCPFASVKASDSFNEPYHSFLNDVLIFCTDNIQGTTLFLYNPHVLFDQIFKSGIIIFFPDQPDIFFIGICFIHTHDAGTPLFYTHSLTDNLISQYSSRNRSI